MPETKIDINLNSQEFKGDSDKAVQSLNAVGKAAGLAFAAIAGGAILSVRAFADFQTALVGVAKTTDLTAKEIASLGAAFQKVSTTLPLATNELLEIAQTAGTLGVTGADNIEKFAITIAKLSTATDDLKGENAARQLSRILGITGDGVENIDRFASSLVALGNTFKTTEGAIAETSIGVASSTTQFKLGAVNVAAISTALSSLGQKSEASATVVGEAFASIDDAIRKGGSSLANLERLTGLSGDELRKTFKEDATEVFKLFNEGLGRSVKAGASLKDELNAIGIRGTRARRVLGALSSQSDVLTSAISLANEAFVENTALNKEFEAASKTINNQFKVLSNIIGVTAQRIGGELAPAVSELLQFFGALFRQLLSSGAFDRLLKQISELSLAFVQFVQTIDVVKLIRSVEFAIDALSFVVFAIGDTFKVAVAGIQFFIDAARFIPRILSRTFATTDILVSSFVSGVADIFGSLGTVLAGVFTLDPAKISEGINGIRSALVDNVTQANDELVSLDESFRSEDNLNRNAIERTITPDPDKVREAFEASKEVSDEAVEIITEDQQALLEAQKAVEEEDLKRRQKFNQDRLKEQVRFGKAFADINSVIQSDQIQGVKSASGELVALQKSENSTLKSIGKAAAVAQISIKTAESAVNIFRGFSTIPFIGQALGIAGAAAAVAFGVEQIAKVTSAQQGGVITGGVPGMDSVPALLEPGELVVPRQNFEEVIAAVAAQRGSAEATAPTGGEAAEAAGESDAANKVEIEVTLSDDAIEIVEARIVDRQQLGVSILLPETA